MKHHRILCAATVATLCFCSATAARADGDPLKDPQVQQTLRAMNDASTWYHPDLFGEYAGVRRYAHKHYKGALKYFKIGAYYADKFSQLCIGLMYLNGRGVKKVPATAFAWLALAAERDYPQFVATRDGVKAGLSPQQLKRAAAIHAKLARKYSDAVAKPRMAHQLRMGMEQMTGSRTGFDFGAMHAAVKDHCASGEYIGGAQVPVAGCGGSGIYAKSRWVPRQYFASRDEQWKATVSVGGLTQVGPGPDEDKSKKSRQPEHKH